MQTDIGKIRLHDVAKGLVTAIIASVLVTMAGIAQQPGFDVFSVDWNATIKLVINVATSSFLAYIVKNLFSDKEGKFAGIL